MHTANKMWLNNAEVENECKVWLEWHGLQIKCAHCKQNVINNDEIVSEC